MHSYAHFEFLKVDDILQSKKLVIYRRGLVWQLCRNQTWAPLACRTWLNPINKKQYFINNKVSILRLSQFLMSHSVYCLPSVYIMLGFSGRSFHIKDSKLQFLGY